MHCSGEGQASRLMEIHWSRVSSFAQYICICFLLPQWFLFFRAHFSMWIRGAPSHDPGHTEETWDVVPTALWGLSCWVTSWKAVHFTLIAANPWARMVPESGMIVNSFGFITGISPLFQNGLLLSEYCSWLEMLLWPTPSPGTRSLKVMGTKEVLLREHIKVWGNPGKQNMRWEIKAPWYLPLPSTSPSTAEPLKWAVYATPHYLLNSSSPWYCFHSTINKSISFIQWILIIHLLSSDNRHKNKPPGHHPGPSQEAASVISLLNSLPEVYFAFNLCTEIQIFFPKNRILFALFICPCVKGEACVVLPAVWLRACQDCIIHLEPVWSSCSQGRWHKIK